MSFTDEQIKETFQLFDADGSGAIDVEELSLALKGLGLQLSKAEVDEMLQGIDKDGNSLVEFNEFEKLVRERQIERDSDAEVRRAFQLFDLDQTGYVTVKNMIEVTRMIGESTTEEQIKEFVKHADKDQDGKLSLNEWKDVMDAMKGK